MGESFPKPMRQRGRLFAWVLCVGVAFGLGVWGVFWFFVWPARTLRAAEEALRRNDPAVARDKLVRYVARWPNDEHALFLAAQASRRCDACADAERYLTALEQMGGPTEESRLEWALLGVQQGDFSDHEAGLRSAISRAHPEMATMAEALAKGYQVAFRWPESLQVLDGLLQRERDHVPALILHSTILGRVRQWDKALESARRAVEQAPQSGSAHRTLARALNELGHTRQAIYHYELALYYRPKDAAALLGLARALVDDGALDDAQRALDELLSLDAKNVAGLVECGRLALRRGKPAEAETFLHRAIAEAPWHREAHECLLTSFREQGRTREAAKAEARVADLQREDGIGGRLRLRARDNPGDIAVRWELWLWCQKNGQFEEGFGWILNLLRVDPLHAQAHGVLADHFEQAGQPRRAAEHRNRAARPGGG